MTKLIAGLQAFRARILHAEFDKAPSPDEFHGSNDSCLIVKSGSGKLSTDSGVLAETPYSFKTRFENEKGTNPEELIAAAHAGCFTMALAFGLQGAGYTPTELSTEAAVTLDPEGQGFRISRSALTLRAKVPNLDEATFARMAGDAEKNCPVSKVLNAEITLDAKLL
jgi:lipoyl-dependent peroxiredoxin